MRSNSIPRGIRQTTPGGKLPTSGSQSDNNDMDKIALLRRPALAQLLDVRFAGSQALLRRLRAQSSQLVSYELVPASLISPQKSRPVSTGLFCVQKLYHSGLTLRYLLV